MQQNLISRSLLLLLVAGSLVLTACKKDDDDKKTDPAPTPTTYEFSDYEANTTNSRELGTRLAALTTEMQKGRNVANTLTAQQLLALYQGVGNTLGYNTESQFAAKTVGWLVNLADQTGKAFNPANPTTGGVFGGYLFDEKGVELEQLVEKGSFGSLLFYRALTDHLTKETLTVADIDNAFAYYGAQPKFPNNNTDRFGARYAARRDNGGHYRRLRDQFLAARAAVAAGNQTAAKNAVAIIREEWEKALGATIINYLYASAEKFPSSADADKASALHAWGEGVGFIYGLRAIPENLRILKNSKIEYVLELMKAEDGQQAPLDFKTPADIAELTKAIQELAEAYGFADPTIYKINDVTANGR